LRGKLKHGGKLGNLKSDVGSTENGGYKLYEPFLILTYSVYIILRVTIVVWLV